MSDFIKCTSEKTNKNLKRGYEGAISSPSFHWRTNTTLANLETQISLEILRNRARQLVRDNSYAESAVAKISTNLIGSGIIPEFKGNFDQNIWNDWADSTDCDADGVLNYYGLQELIIRELVEGGECLIRKMVFGYDKFKKNIPLKLRIFGSEYLDMSKNGIFNGNNYISQGIELDPLGRRVAYWMYPYHPENDLGWRNVSIRIPADEVIHIYKPRRANQFRGITWFAPVLIDLKRSDNYQSAELKRKEQNSSITGFLTDLDEMNPEDRSVSSQDDDTFYEQIKAGTIIKLPNGKNITLTNPQSDSNYDQYNSSILRKIAVGMGISYEVLTGDLSKVNFSSGRMGFIEFQRQLTSWRKNLTIPMFCARISKWFLESAEMCGYKTSKIKHIAYTAPHREMIDPVKETAAVVSAIRNGLKTHKEALKEFGYNPLHFYDEIAEINKILDSKKIILDSDPRKVSQQGIFQNTQNNNKNSNSKNKIIKQKKEKNKNADRA